MGLAQGLGPREIQEQRRFLPAATTISPSALALTQGLLGISSAQHTAFPDTWIFSLSHAQFFAVCKGLCLTCALPYLWGIV